MKGLEDLFKEMQASSDEEAEAPTFLVLLGTWWFARGIALSAAKRRVVRLDVEKQEVLPL